MNFFSRIVYGNSLTDWLIALGIFLGVAFSCFLIRLIVSRHLQVLAKRTDSKVDDFLLGLLTGTRWFFIFAIGLYVGLHFLDLSVRSTRIITSLTVVALLLQTALWGNWTISFWFAQIQSRSEKINAQGAHTIKVFVFLARIALWSLLTLMALDSLGFNITALVAGLGIGGIAIAFALQNILGDIFAYMSIVLDRPFVDGDFIILPDCLGTVEHIGIKTTRLRSLSGEQIIISNSDLLQSRIRNYKTMFERRVLFFFGVVYQTPQEKLRGIPKMVQTIIEAQQKTRFDRAHFKEFGDSALVFEVVYFVLVPDYNQHMDIQQAINLDLFRCFQEHQIEFAYPTQTLYMHPINRLVEERS